MATMMQITTKWLTPQPLRRWRVHTGSACTENAPNGCHHGISRGISETLFCDTDTTLVGVCDQHSTLYAMSLTV